MQSQPTLRSRKLIAQKAPETQQVGSSHNYIEFPNSSKKEVKDQSTQTRRKRRIIFEKGEFLAVLNEDKYFWIGQTRQVVYNTTKEVSIRWLNEENDGYAIGDHDAIDIRCVLTKVNLKRRIRFDLSHEERIRVIGCLVSTLDFMSSNATK